MSHCRGYLTVRIAASARPESRNAGRAVCVKPKGSPECSGSSCRDKHECHETVKHAESTALVLGQQTVSTAQSQTSGSGTWMQEETVAHLSRHHHFRHDSCSMGGSHRTRLDRSAWLMVRRHVSPFEARIKHCLQFYVRRGSTRTNHFSPEKNYRNSSSSSGASQSWLDRPRIAGIPKRCCGMRTSPLASILHLGKKLGNQL